MTKYVARRLLLFLPTMFGASIIVFVVMRFMPGDAIDSLLNEQLTLEPELLEQLRADLGLDEAPHIQYLKWIDGMWRGDFGDSLVRQRPSGAALAERIPVTMQVVALSMFIAVVVAIPLGTLAAVRQDTAWDYTSRLNSIAWLSTPNFVVGTAIIVLPAIWWGLLGTA